MCRDYGLGSLLPKLPILYRGAAQARRRPDALGLLAGSARHRPAHQSHIPHGPRVLRSTAAAVREVTSGPAGMRTATAWPSVRCGHHIQPRRGREPQRRACPVATNHRRPARSRAGSPGSNPGRRPSIRHRPAHRPSDQDVLATGGADRPRPPGRHAAGALPAKWDADAVRDEVRPEERRAHRRRPAPIHWNRRADRERPDRRVPGLRSRHGHPPGIATTPQSQQINTTGSRTNTERRRRIDHRANRCRSCRCSQRSYAAPRRSP
jgi:hypothetical protein